MFCRPALKPDRYLRTDVLTTALTTVYLMNHCMAWFKYRNTDILVNIISHRNSLSPSGQTVILAQPSPGFFWQMTHKLCSFYIYHYHMRYIRNESPSSTRYVSECLHASPRRYYVHKAPNVCLKVVCTTAVYIDLEQTSGNQTWPWYCIMYVWACVEICTFEGVLQLR